MQGEWEQNLIIALFSPTPLRHQYSIIAPCPWGADKLWLPHMCRVHVHIYTQIQCIESLKTALFAALPYGTTITVFLFLLNQLWCITTLLKGVCYITQCAPEAETMYNFFYLDLRHKGFCCFGKTNGKADSVSCGQMERFTITAAWNVSEIITYPEWTWGGEASSDIGDTRNMDFVFCTGRSSSWWHVQNSFQVQFSHFSVKQGYWLY